MEQNLLLVQGRMMRAWRTAIAVLMLTGAAAEAAANEASPLPESALSAVGGAVSSSAGPPPRERPQAVNGTLYAVVAPLYVGEGGFYSYLRLFNGGASLATFTVTVVGSGTSTAYGTATFQIPTRASRQYSMSEVLVAANAVTRSDADAQFSFYIQSTEPLAGYQHITHKPTERYFGNAAVCKWTIQDAVGSVAPSAVLTHVHTSRLAADGYPSAIELHHFGASATTYRFTVIEAASGSIVGETNFPVRANASYSIPWQQIESAVGWSPLQNQLYANVVVTDTSGSIPAVVLGQTVINNQFQVTLNVTTMCAVNRPTGLNGDGGR